MIEKNRNILKNALNDLPKRKAGNSTWENISGLLDHQESSQFLSEKISKLPKHKAPSNIWSGIEKGLNHSWFSFGSFNIIKIVYLVGISTVLAISFVVFSFEEKEQIENISEASLLNSNSIVKSENSINIEDISSQIANNDIISNSAFQENSQTKLIQKKVVSNDKNKVNNLISKKNDNKIKESKFVDRSEIENNSTNIFEFSFLKKIEPKYFKFLDFEFNSVFLFEKREFEEQSFDEDYFITKELYFTTFYSLINFQNLKVDNMKIPKSVSSFGFDFILEKQRFIYKTGISYLTWTEKAKYTINYMQNELIYSYNYVDSALINYSSGEIEYFTTNVDIYDSIAHQKIDEIEYQYKLLQIPFIFGYKVLENRKIFISLNGGLGIDVKIGGQQNLPLFNLEQSNIINNENSLNYRFQVNWRLICGMSFYYRISDKFLYFLEPSYQYYMKSVYKDIDLNNVTYFEFKTGFVYKF